jgi:HD-like signal output (HDOD) protein
LDDPKTDMAQLSKSIVMDPILSGKILKLANSAYFGMTQRVNSIGHALMVIGTLNLKHILYQDGIRKLLVARSPKETEIQNHLWEHATLASVCAMHIHGLFSNADRGTLFTLGLLHDVGKFVLMRLKPVKQTEETGEGNHFIGLSIQGEREMYGIDHALLGRMVFEEWGFSDLMIRIAERHHAPSSTKLDYIGLDPLTVQYLVVLFLADQSAKLFASEENSTSPVLPIHASYLPLTHSERLTNIVLDGSLGSKIKKAKALMKSQI